MVSNANTIVYPRAMVVKSLNAVTTDTAVAASTCADCLTICAELGAFGYVEQVHELDAVINYVSWLCESRNHKKH